MIYYKSMKAVNNLYLYIHLYLYLWGHAHMTDTQILYIKKCIYSSQCNKGLLPIGK